MAVEQYDNYLFIFAHPDDEVYTAGLMHRLIEAGKVVMAAYITSGDAGANAEGREVELDASMRAIGVPTENVHKLRFPEKTVLQNLSQIQEALGDVVTQTQIDCVVGMDYEGGHIVHDASSLLASRTADALGAPHYVFPAYHIEDGQRRAAAFLAGRQSTDTITLTAEEAGVKDRVLAAHAGQADHFQRLQQADSTYLGRLHTREVYRLIEAGVNFGEPAAPELGYDRSGATFDDFSNAVASLSAHK